MPLAERGDGGVGQRIMRGLHDTVKQNLCGATMMVEACVEAQEVDASRSLVREKAAMLAMVSMTAVLGDIPAATQDHQEQESAVEAGGSFPTREKVVTVVGTLKKQGITTYQVRIPPNNGQADGTPVRPSEPIRWAP
jgi:hypothetical protein